MVRKIAEDASDQKVLDDIAEFGWHCTAVFEDDEGPGFAFSIGVFQSFDHPEFIIFGMPPDMAHEVLHLAVEGVKSGTIADLSLPTDELLDGYACVFTRVPETEYRDHVGYCRWYYQGNDFPLYQIVYPDRNGTYPWNADATDAFRATQPVLGYGGKGV